MSEAYRRHEAFAAANAKLSTLTPADGRGACWSEMDHQFYIKFRLIVGFVQNRFLDIKLRKLIDALRVAPQGFEVERIRPYLLDHPRHVMLEAGRKIAQLVRMANRTLIF
ncbi:hypothetical protein V6R98_26235 [Agrobacterium sp. CCNWLW71]|uniref:hypothetical protein n=1 Tax=Agrobacterium TaxID=357 RepID=UPI00187CA8C1